MSALDITLTEEQFQYAGLTIMRRLDEDEGDIIRRLQLDRNTLLVRMKIIAEAIEAGTNLEEVGEWAREAYEEVVLT